MTHFEFFGLPVSFRPDEAALRRVFYENSKKYHPDFFTLADAETQADVLEKSTRNNEAYRTLIDPDRRIRYVLEIKGLLGDEGALPPMPPDFLLDVMDINEALMALELDFDAARYADTLREVDRLEQQMNREIDPILDRYTDPAGDPDLPAVRDYFLKKRYLLRIRENLAKFAPA